VTSSIVAYCSANALELLSSLEVTRSNLLRPAGYFADYLTDPHQRNEAVALQQYVTQLTAPLYTSRSVLLLLLQSVHEVLQQLAEATSEALNLCKVSASSSHISYVRSNDVDFLLVPAVGVAIYPAAALDCLRLVEAACQQLKIPPAATNDKLAIEHDGGSSVAAALAASAVQQSLAAVESVLKSTLPLSTQHQHMTSRSSSINPDVISANTTGSKLRGTTTGSGAPSSCSMLQRLMLSRQLLASWLPPLAAAVAAEAAEAAAAVDQPTSDSSSVDTGCQLHPGRCTTRQQLDAALQTLAAISNSSAGSSMLAPLLLVTDGQAAVLQPLLEAAGLADNTTGVTHPSSASDRQGNRGMDDNISSSKGREVQSSSCWMDLHSLLENSELQAKASAAQPGISSAPVPHHLLGDVLAAVLEPIHLEVHQGATGQLLLAPRQLLHLTDDAKQLLLLQEQPLLESHSVHGACNQQEHQKQLHIADTYLHSSQEHADEGPAGTHRPVAGSSPGPVELQASLPAPSSLTSFGTLPLKLLRVSTDVLQLLLRHHPHVGVRQQLYYSGLLPLLQLQHEVLSCISNLRQQLAVEHGYNSYAHLVLAGSCLGTPRVAARLLQQLQPVLQEYAAAELEQLQAVSTRRAAAAAAARSTADAAGLLGPWDLAYTSTNLVRFSTSA
jgi:hypothetical protein